MKPVNSRKRTQNWFSFFRCETRDLSTHMLRDIGLGYLAAPQCSRFHPFR